MSRISDSKVGKLARTAGAIAALSTAIPATVHAAQAAPKEKIVTSENLKQKRMPESAKKASPAEQMRIARRAVEEEAARMIEEKRIWEELRTANIPVEITNGLQEAKNGRDFSRILGSKEFHSLGADEQFLTLQYVQASRFANEYAAMDGSFYILSHLPLTEKTRDFGMKIAAHVHPRDKNDTGYTLPVSSFMTDILRKSSNQEKYQSLQETNKEWSEKMLLILAKNMPREELMNMVVSRFEQYRPFYKVFSDDTNAVDIGALIRKAYPLQTLDQISKVYTEQAERNPLAEKQSPLWFFGSKYWEYLLPEEQLSFVRKQLPREALKAELMTHVINDGNNLRTYSADNENRIFEELVKVDPNAFLAAFVQAGRSANNGRETGSIKLALQDPRTSPNIRVQFLKYSVQDNSGTFAIRDEILRAAPPEEVILTQNRDPSAKKFSAPIEEMFYRQRYGNANIYDDEALQHVREVPLQSLPKELQKLPARETAQWQVMIARNLFFQDKKPTTESIQAEAERIQQFREKYAEYPLFQHTIVASHEELFRGRPRFGTPEFLLGIRKHATDTVSISPHVNHEGGDFRTTKETLRRAKEEVLSRIRTTPAALTFVADMHGGGHDNGAIYLSDGQIQGTLIEEKEDGKKDPGKNQITETERTEKITADELAQAFIERYRDPVKRQSAERRPDVVIMASCMSSNVVRSMAKILKEAKVPIPIFIAMAEYGQSGYSHFWIPEGADFNKNTILQKETDKTPTVGGVIEYDQKQRDSEPVLLVPDDKGNYMQLSDAEWFGNVRTNVV